MARMRRLKVMGEESYYHVISRTAGQLRLLNDVEKETLVKIIEYYSGIYFVKVIGLCVMSNHFHILLKTEPEIYYGDPEVKARLKKYLKIPIENMDSKLIGKYREKLEDISEYMRNIKQTFSCWFNKTHHRTGYLWGDRFKSVWIEKGDSLLTCLAYIDLNPIRAGMVKRPEEYRWSSFGMRVNEGKAKGFLSFDGLFGEAEKNDKTEMLSNYRYWVYRCGNITRLTKAEIEAGKKEDTRPRISDADYEMESKRGFKIPKPELMMKRMRYFSDGLVIGSKGFIQEAYSRFGGQVILKKERKAYQTGLLETILSLRNLKKSQPG